MVTQKRRPLDNDVMEMETSNSSGFTCMEIYATVVAAFSFLNIGLLRAYTSPAISSMMQNPEIFNTTSIPEKEVISWFASAPPLASFIGTVISGPLLQYCGRQATIVILSIPYIFGWLLIGLAQDVLMILSGRILTGLAAGISTAAAQLYVSECVRPEVRGTLGFLPSMMLALGVLLGFAASTINVEWRELALIMGGFPILLLIMSLTVPESPPWLIMRGKEKKAVRNLKKFRGPSTRFDEIEEEIELIKSALPTKRRKVNQAESSSLKSFDKEETLEKKKSVCTILTQREIVFPAFIAVSLMMFQQFAAANVVIYFLSVILREAEPIPRLQLIISQEISHDNTSIINGSMENVNGTRQFMLIKSTAIQPFSPNVSSVIVGVVQFLAFFLSLPLIDRMGRKVLLISSANLMAIPLGLLGLYFYCNANSETNEDLQYIVDATYSWLPLTCLCVFIASYSIGYGPVPFIIMSEIFPGHARSYLCSLTSFSNHFFLFVVIKMFPMMVDWIGSHWTFWMFAGSCLLSIILVVFAVPETKGKTLAEIEQNFAKEVIPLLDRKDSYAVGLP